ncbi:MAG: hypothetical protein FWG38_05880 [Defluviitaleaceae bacterium]|nr:hypothetical protein [Defluviitaleaceae bacterium]
MAFPLTHLCVAYNVLTQLPSPDPAQFILGSIAPDAVHFRGEFLNATIGNIGATKKVTHLCPVSDEKWGQVTDNDGWVDCVKAFLRQHPRDAFASGYAVHVLTDIYNNLTLWREFITKHPAEAAKGYTSDYYRDLRCIDFRIYNAFFKSGDLRALLAGATPQEIPGLVAADELAKIQHNLLHVQYVDVPEDVDTGGCFYLTYEQTLQFIQNAADFCVRVILEAQTV